MERQTSIVTIIAEDAEMEVCDSEEPDVVSFQASNLTLDQ